MIEKKLLDRYLTMVYIKYAKVLVEEYNKLAGYLCSRNVIDPMLSYVFGRMNQELREFNREITVKIEYDYGVLINYKIYDLKGNIYESGSNIPFEDLIRSWLYYEEDMKRFPHLYTPETRKEQIESCR